MSDVTWLSSQGLLRPPTERKPPKDAQGLHRLVLIHVCIFFAMGADIVDARSNDNIHDEGLQVQRVPGQLRDITTRG